MTVEPQSPTVWPLWGRVLFATLFVLVLVAAAVAAASGGFQITPSAIRVYVAAVLVPGLLVLGVSAISLRRASSLRTRLARQLGTISAAAAADQDDDPTLREAGRVADRARAALEQRDTSSAVNDVRRLPELAARRPALASPCAEAARTADRLQRAVDVAQRRRR